MVRLLPPKLSSVITGIAVAITLLAMGSSPARAQYVEIEPGTDIQTVVNANPAGTAYLLKAGTHREQQITPKTGDSYIGEYGAILTGAKLLEPDDFVASSSAGIWYITGQTQEAWYPGTDTCGSSNPLCYRPNDLFIDDDRVMPVASIAAVTADTFFFDYPNDTIYIGTDPAGKTIEASVTNYAFLSTSENHNVIIRNLIIEKYANPAQRAAIQGNLNGDHNLRSTGWVVENNEIRFNHAGGVYAGDDWIVRYNKIFNNGQIGIKASGDGALIAWNEIAYNNDLSFSIGFEAGASKFAYTTNLDIFDNYVHHNYGIGLWTDINNYFADYQRNLVTYNTHTGIKHEISYDVSITDNFSAYNGTGDYSWVWGSQIHIQNSSNATVSGNTIIIPSTSEGDGLNIINQERGNDPDTGLPYVSLNNVVENNTVWALSLVDFWSGVSCDNCPEASENYNQMFSQNYFRNNTYYVPALGISRYTKFNLYRTLAQIQAAGDEVGSVEIADLSGVPDIPAWPDNDYNIGTYATTPDPSPTPESSPSPTSMTNHQLSAHFGIATPPMCVDQVPHGVPDLFQIDRTDAGATLYISPVGGQVSGYHVIFGHAEGEELFGGISLGNQSTSQTGVQSITIHHLSKNVPYAFKVIPINGCAVGTWSNWLTSHTTGKSYRYMQSSQ